MLRKEIVTKKREKKMLRNFENKNVTKSGKENGYKISKWKK